MFDTGESTSHWNPMEKQLRAAPLPQDVHLRHMAHGKATHLYNVGPPNDS
jgi:hypothetical protein